MEKFCNSNMIAVGTYKNYGMIKIARYTIYIEREILKIMYKPKTS